MKIRRDQTYAVVTGDVVGFKKLSLDQRAHLGRILHRASGELQERFHDCVPFKIDYFRGDSWQFVVSKPERSVRAALFFRAYLKSRMPKSPVDTRLAIGLGPIDFLPRKAISTGDGEAYRRSGMALDKMPRGTRMRIDGPRTFGSLDLKTADVLVRLIDAIARDWTDRQATAVCGAILHWKQTEIASVSFKGAVTQQAVAQHLERAGWNAVEAALSHIEESWAINPRGVAEAAPIAEAEIQG